MLIFERDRRPHAARRTRGLCRFEASVEAMEGRRLLTGSGATILLAGSTIEVIGSNNGDTSVVSLQKGSVDVNISNSQGSDDVLFPASQVASIEYFGGSGNNTFTNATSLTGSLYGGSGNNVLNGGSYHDYLYATSSGTNVLNAGSGFEILQASGTGNNSLNGGSGYNTIITFAGNNQILGGPGVTCVLAIGGQNEIDGGTGDSLIFSCSPTDVIIPEAYETVIHVGY